MSSTAQSKGQMLLREMTSGAKWALIGQVGTLAFGLVLSVLAARLLSPSDAGKYFTLTAIVALTSLLAEMGKRQILTRAVATSTADGISPYSLVRLVFLQSAVLSVGIGFSAAFLLVLTRPTFRPDDWGLAIVFAVFLGFWTAARTAETLASSAHRGLGRFGEAAITERFGALAVASAGILLLAATQGRTSVATLVLINFVSTMVIAIWSTISLRQSIRRSRWLLETPSTLLLRGSLSMWTVSIASLVAQGAGLWVLIIMGAPEEVALFGVAQKLVLPVLLPLAIVNGFVGPLIATMARRREYQEMQDLLRSTASIAGAIALIAAAALVLLGPIVLRLAFGPFYTDAYPIALALLVGAVGSVLSGAPGTVLVMTNSTRVFAWVSLAFGAATLALGFVAYELSGTVAVAVAVSAMTIIRFTTLSAIVYRSVGVKTYAMPKWAQVRDTLSAMRTRQALTVNWTTGDSSDEFTKGPLGE